MPGLNYIWKPIVWLIVLLFACKPVQNELSLPKDDFQWDKYEYPNEENIQKKIQNLQRIKNAISLRSPDNPFNANFKEQGPGNIGGRVTSIAIHPTNVNILYAGYSIGGLFKSINGGTSWEPLFDQELTNSIGAIAIDPKNPEIVYVGTGDPDINGNSFIGNGIYKSINGGRSWTNIGLTEVRIINEIIIDPFDSKIIYVGAMGNPFEASLHRGVYKTEDGGISWTKSLFVGDNAGITDLEIDPMNSNIIYAVSFQRIRTPSVNIAQGPLSKIFKSVDGGNIWKEVMNGMKFNEYSRISIALSASQPNIIYARTVRYDSICNPGAFAYDMEGIYRSNNQAENWTKINSDLSFNNCDYMGGFGWYFGHIAVHPNDPDHIYLLGVNSCESLDGGKNTLFFELYQNTFDMHVDHHILVFDRSENFILGTDGGLYKYNATDKSWSDIENIATTQFYRVNWNPHKADIYYGGAQDNGTVSGSSTEFNKWNNVFGGDGFQSAFHSQYPHLAWHEYQYGNIRQLNYSTGTQNRFDKNITGTRNWDCPYFISEHNEDIMYFGSNKVFVNFNPLIDNWKAVSSDLTINGPFPNYNSPSITCMHESPISPNILIVGTSNGNVWIGNSKSNVWNLSNSNLPIGYVTSVKASTVDTNTFYVSFSNYRRNDLNAYLFITKDKGKSWISMVNGILEQQAINDICIIPNKDDQMIFAGTLTGIYGTIDHGNSWHRVGNNMPLIPVNSLLYSTYKKELIVGSFARSLWTYNLSALTQTSRVENTFEMQIPNITKDRITLKSDGISNITVCNVSGEILLNQLIRKDQPETNIEVGSLPPSVYFLIAEKNGKKLVKKWYKY
ncbi:MAG: hypothetical protein IT267_03570 [Saprospiraceae bacterium]|nr:hypothetical protein [Saprospiraceae bacterium]